MRKISRFISVALAVVTLGALTFPVSAQTPNTQTGAAGNGIRISPVRTEVTMSPGEVKVLTLNVQNITSGPAELQAIINDFTAGKDELGQPALILDADKYAPSHSLKRHIAAIPNQAMAAGESKNVKVTISLPKDIKAGGYYGAVRFTPVSGKTGNNVTLSASVGSLILVRVPGDIVENVTVASFDTRKGVNATNGSSFFTSNKDLFAVVRFKNSGTAHEQPFGKVVVKKGNKTIQTTEINATEPRGNVLPDSTRRFTVKLDKVGLWGKYTVEGNFGYGTNGQLISAKTSFFVFPLLFIVIGLLLLALLGWAIFGLPRAIKKYNQNVLRKAGRR